MLQQITGENLLLTLLGGVLGLVLSYVLLGVFSEQFNGMVPGEAMAMAFTMEKVEAAVFSVRDFFKLKLYVLLLAIVLVLNIVSALIPAFKVIGLCLNRYSNNSGSTAAAMRGSSWR